jgi:mono/diheme cytochrome c family protein
MRSLVFAHLAAVVIVVAPRQASSQANGDGGAMSALQRERVERLLEGRVACRGCHTVAGSGGSIGPSLDGLGERVTRDYVLSVIRDPSGTIPGTIMPLQRIPDRDAERLASYLMTLTPSDPGSDAPAAQAPPVVDPADQRDGSALYARHCASCHGESGAGNGWNAATLPVPPTAHSDPDLMSARPDDTLYDAIAGGGYVLDRSARMPAFGAMLAPEQIRALVSYIRELCACEQPSWAGGR